MTATRPGFGPQPPRAPNGDPQPPPGDPDRRAEGRDWPPVWRLVYLPSGVLFLLSPVLLLGSPLLMLYSLARIGRIASYRLFRDDAPARVHDQAVARVKTLRMWAAALVSLGVLSVFGTREDMLTQFSDRWGEALVAPWLLIASAPVVIGVLFLCATPTQRPVMRAALRGPLGKLARFVGTLALVPALFFVLYLGHPSVLTGDLHTLLFLVGVGVYICSTFLFLFSGVRVVRTGFGTADVHPTLPALLTSVLVWEFAVLGGPPDGPPPIAYAMLIGGPASVTAIAWWEIRRLRRYHGVTLRGG